MGAWHVSRACVTSRAVLVMWLAGLVTASSPSQADRQKPGLWLSDQTFYNDVDPDARPQSDQAQTGQQTELCPPVPEKLLDGACRGRPCTSDRECSKTGARKCCYNGCVYTCLPELAPPAFIDWIREPRRRLRSGLSWLISGPDQANEAEPCSTSLVDGDADPLLCPSGLVCSIHDPGDPARGIPNQGTCLRLAARHAHPTEKKEPAEKPRAVKHKHACDLDGEMLLEGHAILLNGQQCLCKGRRLFCAGKEEKISLDKSDDSNL